MAALDLCARIGWSSFKPYLPPIMAATVIQNAYRAYVHNKSCLKQRSKLAISVERIAKSCLEQRSQLAISREMFEKHYLE